MAAEEARLDEIAQAVGYARTPVSVAPIDTADMPFVKFISTMLVDEGVSPFLAGPLAVRIVDETKQAIANGKLTY